MEGLLQNELVLMHPFVLGEIAMGSLKKRAMILNTLSEFDSAPIAHEEEVLSFVEAHNLFGQGIGYVDAHLITSVKLLPGTTFWTRDKRLRAVATKLGIAYQPLVN